MTEQTKKEFNPLQAIGRFIMQLFGIVGMVSFTEDIVAWKDRIIKLATAYQKIVSYPFLQFDFSIPERLIDYLFIGSLLGISYAKAISYGITTGRLSTRGMSSIWVKGFYYVLYLLFWPIGMLVTFKQAFIGKPDESERSIKVKFLQWTGTALLIFFLVLTINTLWL